MWSGWRRTQLSIAVPAPPQEKSYVFPPEDFDELPSSRPGQALGRKPLHALNQIDSPPPLESLQIGPAKSPLSLRGGGGKGGAQQQAQRLQGTQTSPEAPPSRRQSSGRVHAAADYESGRPERADRAQAPERGQRGQRGQLAHEPDENQSGAVRTGPGAYGFDRLVDDDRQRQRQMHGGGRGGDRMMRGRRDLQGRRGDEDDDEEGRGGGGGGFESSSGESGLRPWQQQQAAERGGGVRRGGPQLAPPERTRYSSHEEEDGDSDEGEEGEEEGEEEEEEREAERLRRRPPPAGGGGGGGGRLAQKSPPPAGKYSPPLGWRNRLREAELRGEPVQREPTQRELAAAGAAMDDLEERGPSAAGSGVPSRSQRPSNAAAARGGGGGGGASSASPSSTTVDPIVRGWSSRPSDGSSHHPGGDHSRLPDGALPRVPTGQSPSAPPIATGFNSPSDSPLRMPPGHRQDALLDHHAGVNGLSRTRQLAPPWSPGAEGGMHDYDVEESGQEISGGDVFGHRSYPHTADDSAQALPFSRRQLSYTSGMEAWQAVVAYDACVRMCLMAEERGSVDARQFLQDGCFLLRMAFGLQQVLLQPGQGAKKGAAEEQQQQHDGAPKSNSKKRAGRVIKLQARKVRMVPPARGGGAFASRAPPMSPRGAGGYMKGMVHQMSSILKERLHSGSPDPSQEGLFCTARLKSMPQEEAQCLSLGTHETLPLHPEGANDDIIVEVHDSRGLRGRATIPLSTLNSDQVERLQWVSFFAEGEQESCGKVQLALSYFIEGGQGTNKWGMVGETLAYDCVLEAALQMLGFERRHLHLQGPWRWLLDEFASVFAVSETYKSLRYMTHIMDVATPTEDCLLLIYDLMTPVIKARADDTLTRQEKRILADVEEQVAALLALTFQSYKVLDEAAPSGVLDGFRPATGAAAPALSPAVLLYGLLHDVLLPEAQAGLRLHIQTAAKNRCRRHLADTDEFVAPGGVPEAVLGEAGQAEAYARMQAACLHVSNEVRTDFALHNQHVFPSFIDLPTVTAGVYLEELVVRLGAFLKALPPRSPTPAATELLHVVADLEADLTNWGFRPIPGGLNAKVLFEAHIEQWVQDVRAQLLDLCKSDKARLMEAAVLQQPERHATSPFVEDVYTRIQGVLATFDGILTRWPEFAISLESALCDVERGVMAALERHFLEHLLPLRDTMGAGGASKNKFKTLTKLARRKSSVRYGVPPQLGLMLNSIKRLLETLRPSCEASMRMWVANLPAEPTANGRAPFGERLSEVTVELRAKYKNILQAIIEKICEDVHASRATYLKRILQDTKAQGGEDMSKRMQPLVGLLSDAVTQLDSVLSVRVFVAVCRGLWDRQARDVLLFLENRKENMSWYKSSSAGIALEILDNTFASQMQRLQGHALQEKDLEPPRSVLEARSMLSKDVPNGGTDTYDLF